MNNMIGRVIEIQEDGRHLSLRRGFLIVTENEIEIAQVPLDEISVIITNAYQLTYSHALLMELTKRGIAFVGCDKNHLPLTMLWPVTGYFKQSSIMWHQVLVSKPIQKQVWKQLIQAKILFQQEVLDKAQIKDHDLGVMAKRVGSGDPDNIEAQAARRYWPLLMGKDFIRNRAAPGVNAMLNYGYSIVRSAVARAIMACGLHPTFGIHHRNIYNPMCLVDDLMEPYRPIIDWEVYSIIHEGETELNKDVKKRLALTLLQDCKMSHKVTPVSIAIMDTVQSVAKCFQDEKAYELIFPERLFNA